MRPEIASVDHEILSVESVNSRPRSLGVLSTDIGRLPVTGVDRRGGIAPMKDAHLGSTSIRRIFPPHLSHFALALPTVTTGLANGLPLGQASQMNWFKVMEFSKLRIGRTYRSWDSRGSQSSNGRAETLRTSSVTLTRSSLPHLRDCLRAM